ncbi:hypothetical protein [Thermoanaerobacterium sp. DL9XJH110]|uniref:hypothetical protein n=1 Tax=Thermoanaerobacterium sp. DL9XJH110 TaxID=3386643 RepID=UPI003BB719FE
MDVQMMKLLKLIQKNEGKITYNELCRKYPLDINVITKLLNIGYIHLKPIDAYGKPTSETKVFLSLDGRSYLIEKKSEGFKEFIRIIVVPIITGVLSAVLSFLILKLID